MRQLRIYVAGWTQPVRVHGGKTAMKASSIRWVSVKILLIAALSSTLALAENRAEDSLSRKTIAHVPTIVDYYLGAPNLKVLKANKKGLFDDPTIFRQSLDEEAVRIQADIDLALAQEFQRRGLTVKPIGPPQFSQEEIATRQSELWPVVYLACDDCSVLAKARETPDPVSPDAAEIAESATADLVLVARFWGWRKGGPSMPVMGVTKSASQLWVALFDGTSGEVVWVGNNSASSSFFSSKNKEKQLAKLIKGALRSLTPID
jgi:hypothetical protein